MRSARATGGAWFVCRILLSATRGAYLDRGTGYRSVTAKHTTVAGLRFQFRAALGALVKEKTCIRRHRLFSATSALMTIDNRLHDLSARHVSVFARHWPLAVFDCLFVFDCFF